MPQDPMKVLLIAYYFPPFGGGASVRLHNFAKYLPHYGVTPVVLTVGEQYYEEIYRDPTLLQEYAPEVTIHRTAVLFGAKIKRAKAQAYCSGGDLGLVSRLKRNVKRKIRNLFVPDEQIFWLPIALLQARKLLKQNLVKAIVATGPPFSGHLLGALTSRICKIPLILDYRDLWTENPFMSGRGVVIAVNRRLEALTIRQADKIICTNTAAAHAIARRFHLAEGKTVVIENGFDADSISRAEKKSTSQRRTLKLNYLGSLTKDRSPYYFLASLKKATAANPGVDLEVGFVGFVAEDHVRLVQDMGLQGYVKFHGPVSKEMAMDIMCNDSDVLLVLQRRSEGGATAIPGKIYEYLATGKPIICMDEGGGATTTLLEELGIDCAVEYDDEEGITRLLQDILSGYDVVAAKFSSVVDRVKPFDRKVLTGALADIIVKIQ
jgi:glycosyltransferase involved in cell wall biosynthesis